MWQVLIVVAVLSTALARLFSFYYGVQAVGYLALVPLFAFSIVALLLTPGRVALRRMDVVMAALVAFPIVVAPISLAVAMGTSVDFPSAQFAKQVIWAVLMYSAYFATRFMPPRATPFVFWTFLVVVGASVPVIFLQQMGLMGQFYWASNTTFLSSYLDASGISRFRNTGFFGYAHDAGGAMLLLTLAAYALYMTASASRTKMLALAGMLTAFTALILTSSRGTAALAILTIASNLLFLEPLLSPRKGVVLLGLFRFSGILAVGTFVVWGIYEVWPDLFSPTLFFSHGFSFLTQEGRISTTLYAISYLLSDPLHGLLGWGQGTGGLAPVQGLKILPVNTIDTTLAATLANFGLMGLTFYVVAFSMIIAGLAKIRREIFVWVRQNKEDYLIIVLCQFSLLAIWALLLSFIVGYAVTDRVYCNLTFLCLGALMSRYDRMSRRAVSPARKSANVVAPRTA